MMVERRDTIPPEPDGTIVKCNGGGSILGHPLIYLNLGLKDKIICPYCSKEFVNFSLKKEQSRH